MIHTGAKELANTIDFRGPLEWRNINIEKETAFHLLILPIYSEIEDFFEDKIPNQLNKPIIEFISEVKYLSELNVQTKTKYFLFIVLLFLITEITLHIQAEY